MRDEVAVKTLKAPNYLPNIHKPKIVKNFLDSSEDVVPFISKAGKDLYQKKFLKGTAQDFLFLIFLATVPIPAVANVAKHLSPPIRERIAQFFGIHVNESQSLVGLKEPEEVSNIDRSLLKDTPHFRVIQMSRTVHTFPRLFGMAESLEIYGIQQAGFLDKQSDFKVENILPIRGKDLFVKGPSVAIPTPAFHEITDFVLWSSEGIKLELGRDYALCKTYRGNYFITIYFPDKYKDTTLKFLSGFAFVPPPKEGVLVDALDYLDPAVVLEISQSLRDNGFKDLPNLIEQVIHSKNFDPDDFSVDKLVTLNSATSVYTEKKERDVNVDEKSRYGLLKKFLRQGKFFGQCKAGNFAVTEEVNDYLDRIHEYRIRAEMASGYYLNPGDVYLRENTQHAYTVIIDKNRAQPLRFLDGTPLIPEDDEKDNSIAPVYFTKPEKRLIFQEQLVTQELSEEELLKRKNYAKDLVQKIAEARNVLLKNKFLKNVKKSIIQETPVGRIIQLSYMVQDLLLEKITLEQFAFSSLNIFPGMSLEADYYKILSAVRDSEKSRIEMMEGRMKFGKMLSSPEKKKYGFIFNPFISNDMWNLFELFLLGKFERVDGSCTELL